MIRFNEKNGALIFNVRVVPRASKSEIVGEHDGALKIRICRAAGRQRGKCGIDKNFGETV